MINILFPDTLSIRTLPDSTLRTKAKKMDEAILETPEAQHFFDSLQKIMIASDGIGIASPQVGVSLRVAIVSDNGKNHQLLINPEITWRSKEENVLLEGCLSVPHTFGEVTRPKSVHIKALDRNGKKIKIKAKGMLSRVIQHEIDHLDGILFIDKAKNIQKDVAHTVAI